MGADGIKATVRIAQTGECFPCAAGESLLEGMAKLGRRGIPVGCLNGGCGVCKVHVLCGEVRKLGPCSRAHLSADEESAGYALACRVAPAGDVELEVAGKMQKPFLCCAGKRQAPASKP
ncbi:ferredoxin [Cupriavidus necator]|uniref:2Fe-2S iron-sulfur cluster-binding protein n=1 Tax=Cupriavidus necator TaxID=106590 RepID=UPI00073538D0|nr:2Fe-2S iron-sulfur cluster-binding protein [Cupriavidus necator]KUE85109.1 ferredoxin [Cupriavidus necator]